jgi:Sporulation initiation factor Spo0A C terminal.
MNRAKIEDALLSMGIPAGILGFNYIVDAMQIFDERGTNIGITKELYPAIAKKNSTTPSRAERAIRHAFERVRSYGGNPEIVNHYIGMDNCENSSSLKMLYIRIKQDCGESEKKERVEETSNQETETSITALEIRKIIRQELRMFLDELNVVQT